MTDLSRRAGWELEDRSRRFLMQGTSQSLARGHFQATKCPRGSLPHSPHQRNACEEAVATRVCNHLQTSGPQPWQPRKIYCGDGQKTKNSCANFTEPHYEKCLSSASLLSVPDAAFHSGQSGARRHGACHDSPGQVTLAQGTQVQADGPGLPLRTLESKVSSWIPGPPMPPATLHQQSQCPVQDSLPPSSLHYPHS